jgi:hypothetical protein
MIGLARYRLPVLPDSRGLLIEYFLVREYRETGNTSNAVTRSEGEETSPLPLPTRSTPSETRDRKRTGLALGWTNGIYTPRREQGRRPRKTGLRTRRFVGSLTQSLIQPGKEVAKSWREDARPDSFKRA